MALLYSDQLSWQIFIFYFLLAVVANCNQKQTVASVLSVKSDIDQSSIRLAQEPPPPPPTICACLLMCVCETEIKK